jgi:hypothetical protein
VSALGTRAPDVTRRGAEAARFALPGVALVVVLAPLAAASWLALLTAHLGRLSPPVALGGGAAALIAVALVGWRRGWRADVTVPGVLAVALAGLGAVAAVPAATPWPAFLDASWYVNTGARLAREGSLALRSEAADLPDGARRAVVATFADQLRAGIAQVPGDASRGLEDVIYAVDDVTAPAAAPYHPPLFTAWVALWVRLTDVRRAGEAVLPWALAWLLAVGALAHAAFGSRAAPLAVALVAIGPAFAYYGRTPYAEMTGGALALGGLAALATVAGGDGPRPRLVALGGLSLGLALLAKLDLVPLVAAAIAWWVLARRRSGGRLEGAALAGGLAVPLAHGAALALGPSRLYVALNGGGVVALARASWATFLTVLVIAAFAGLVVWALARTGRGYSATDLRRHVALLVVGALVVETLRGLQAPADAHPGMVELLAYLASPLALWAAALALAWALESGPPGAGPVVAAALLAVPVVLAEPAITASLSPLYTARRLVPYVLPIVAVLAASLAARGLERDRQRRGVVLLVLGGCVLVAANLALAARPLRGAHEFSGGVRAAEWLAARGGPTDVYLFATILDGSTAGRLAPALTNLTGRTSAVIASPDTGGADLAAAVDAWRRDGRRVLLVADSADVAPAIPGYETRADAEMTTTIIPMALAPSPLLPPRWAPVELPFAIMELVPVADSP